MKNIALIVMLFITVIGMAQTVIKGKVVDWENRPIPGTNIILDGSNEQTQTDFDGNFTFSTSKPLPFTLVAFIMGYDSVSQEITAQSKSIQFTLKGGTGLDLIIISASRTPEKIFESPVTVEYYSEKEIKNTSSVDFYTGLENIKGIDVNTNSLTYKSINTRGYGSFDNTRFVQLIDGADNSSPALNFSLGNLVGISELDVADIELLPGASSALYGANAFNGILFMNSKNPFDYPGISAYYKRGVTDQEASGTNSFFDFGIRAAHKFSNKFAAKINVSYMKGTDWHATNLSNLNNPLLDNQSDPNYNGVNVYGDEISTNLRSVAAGLVREGLLPAGAEASFPDQAVSRTGYEEKDLVDYNAESFKFSGSLHYRPSGDDLEILYSSRLGRGTTLFQSANRFYAPNYFSQQHKLEIKDDHFFVRGYITSGDAGDTYDTVIAAININNKWKSNETWFGEYAQAYQSTIGLGASEEVAHSSARAFADTGRYVPGTAAFENAFNSVISDPDFTTGAKFQDESQLRHVDANYNLSYITDDFADIQVGGSFREYRLRSFGTVFTDPDGPISYSEVGIYTQLQKLLLDARFKITGSIRYDKSELFEGNFSPRLSLGYNIGEERNHNIRASVQTGFRNPETQRLFMGLDISRAILMGSAADNLDRETRTYDLSDNGTAINNGESTKTITGRDAIDNSYTLNSVLDFNDSLDPSALIKSNIELVKPEKVTVFEIGYRGKFDKFSLEASAYYNNYKDFILSKDVIAPFYGEPTSEENFANPSLSLQALINGDFNIYRIASNTSQNVQSFGTVIGIKGRLLENYDFGLNYTFAKENFDETEIGRESEFNTPEHKVKATFGNENLFNNFGFNTSVRWNSSFRWKDGFGPSEIPSFTVIDAQVNYTIPSLKSTLKLGGTNLGGKEFYNALGVGHIGSQYYIGIAINNL